MRIALVTLFVLSLTLAACGEGEQGGGGEEQAITEVVVTSATSDDPADCLRLYTKEFLEQGSGLEGEAAVRLCEEGATRSLDAESVAVTRIEVDGSVATADAAFTGSGLDGQTVRVGLIEEDESWKLDSFQDFVRFDREKLLAAMEKELDALADSKLEERLGHCVLDRIETFDDAGLESVILGGSSDAMGDLAEACARNAQADRSS